MQAQGISQLERQQPCPGWPPGLLAAALLGGPARLPDRAEAAEAARAPVEARDAARGGPPAALASARLVGYAW